MTETEYDDEFETHMDFFSKQCLQEIIDLEGSLQVEKSHLANCHDFTP